LPTTSKKIAYPVVLILTVLIFGFFLSDLLLYERNSGKIALQRGTASTNEVQRHINVYLDSVLLAAAEIANLLSEEEQISEWNLKELIRQKSHSPKFISGITVAYEPGAFGYGKELYAPYYRIDEGDFLDIATVYDYTADTLPTAIWYTQVVKAGKPVWSEPYYAEGAQMIVADYGVPFYYSGEKRRIRGVVSTTIPLKTFSGIVNAMNLGKAGFAFMVSDSGKYLTHPIKSYVLQKNIYDLAEELDLSHEVTRIMEQNSGYIASSAMYEGQDMSLSFTAVPHSNWKLISVFIPRELVPEFNMDRRKTINMWMSSSVLLFVVLIGLFRINGLSDKELWMLAVLFSIIVIPNIVLIWHLNLRHELIVQSEDEIDMLSPEILERYVGRQNTRLMHMEQQSYHTIPTGLYIEQMEFVDSYNVNVSGMLWQRLPLDLSSRIRPGFHMPQISPYAEAGHSELISQDTVRDVVVYLWRFRNTLRMSFDYARFPFDLRQVKLQILHPDPYINVFLEPDLASYTILEPRLRPAINPDIVLPNSVIVLSKYSFTRKNFATTLGRPEAAGLDEIPVLQFNVLLKRRFINSFVTHVIPIIVVAVLLFLVLFSTTKKRDSLSGVSSLGGVETSAAFFFVLVLAHIDLRRSVTTPDISYMEIFYFLMYCMLGLVTINIVVFTKLERNTLFDHKDNFWVKLMYWPFLLFMMLAFTLGYFY
jgi:hypothetical protein